MNNDLKFCNKYIKIKSNWFDKKGIISKIGCDAFLLYITLFKFRLASQNRDEYKFITSIKALKKETRFTIEKTYDLFKKLVRYKLVKCNVSRWDRYKDNELMIVTATDVPNTIRKIKDDKEHDSPVTDDDYYISVDLNMMQHYLDLGFSGEEMALYCLIRKHSNNTEKKSVIPIDEMSEVLSLSNDKIHKMIHDLNRQYLLASDLRRSKRIKNKYYYEHFLCANYYNLEKFKNEAKSIIEKNIKKWDARLEKKKKTKKQDNTKDKSSNELLNTLEKISGGN